MATDVTKPALLFGAAIEIYNANKAFANIDPTTITAIPVNPINPIVLSPLGADNIYAKSLSDAFSALVFDNKSINTKDTYAKYQLSFKTSADVSGKVIVSVGEVSKVAKNADFGTGNDNVKENINYTNQFGDKLVVKHQYITTTTNDKFDHSLKLHSTVLDNHSQVFTAEAGSKAIRSALTTYFQSRFNFHAKNNTGITEDKSKQIFNFKLSTVKIGSTIVSSTTSTDDDATFLSSNQTKDISYVNTEKNADNAYKLHYNVTQSIKEDKTITKLNQFSFSDNAITIDAKGIIDGETVTKGALKVGTAYFTLITNEPSSKDLAALSTDGYGDKSALDGLFSSTTEFKGTDNSDKITVKTLKPVGATTRAMGNAVELKVDAGAGDDTIICSKGGSNTITGGDGKDTFVIGNSCSGSIVIKSTTITTDMAGTESVEDFSAAFTAANAILKTLSAKGERFAFEFDSTNGYLFDDVNGDGKADQVIVLTGIDNTGINAKDIIT